MDFFKKLLVIFSSDNPEDILTQVVVKANEKELKKSSKLGWVMPLALPYPTYKEFISDDSNTKDEFDEYFTNFYDADFENNLKKSLLDNISFVDNSLQKLISQAITCYEQKLFQICIPALFSVLEGALVELSNKGDRKSIRYRGGLNDSVAKDKLGLSALPLISISWFLDYAFSKSDFEQNGFEELNRHWAQHGRYSDSLGKSSALKLFSAVALVLFAYKLSHNKSSNTDAVTSAGS
jgi:hypothetical protein